MIINAICVVKFKSDNCIFEKAIFLLMIYQKYVPNRILLI
jgi:hypothetical protein